MGKFTEWKQERSYSPNKSVLRSVGNNPLYIKKINGVYRCERDSRYAITSERFHKESLPKK